jgi:hypothetical protein
MASGLKGFPRLAAEILARVSADKVFCIRVRTNIPKPPEVSSKKERVLKETRKTVSRKQKGWFEGKQGRWFEGKQGQRGTGEQGNRGTKTSKNGVKRRAKKSPKNPLRSQLSRFS